MTHPVVLKTSQLILAGDLSGAEQALVEIADTEGDTALVEILDQVPAKDLLAIMRGFDGSKESVINMVVTPEQFAQAIVLEARYRDETHAALRGMMNAVLYRDEEMAAEYLETIGELEGGYEVLVNYFGDRDEEFLSFAMSGEFTEEYHWEGGLAARSITWLNEKIDEIDEALHEGNSIAGSRPKVPRSEIADHDWMETAWVLRYELSDIFEQVVIAMRDRMVHDVEERVDSVATAETRPKAAEDEEESAL
jgi:hypothetical protein